MMITQKQDARKTRRGVPISTYHRVRRMVLAGEITWKKAEKLGWVGPAAKKGRKKIPVSKMRSG